jgi:hypothetical protein
LKPALVAGFDFDLLWNIEPTLFPVHTPNRNCCLYCYLRLGHESANDNVDIMFIFCFWAKAHLFLRPEQINE